MDWSRHFRFRAFTWLLAGALALLLGSYALACIFLSTERFQGPPSGHFDGSRFFNPGMPPRDGFGNFAKWMWTRRPGAWLPPERVPPAPSPPRRVGPGMLRVTPIGHMTVLIQMDGINLLTDPVFSDRIGPFSFIGPVRHRPPGIGFEQLPPIDAVLITHNHYDHLEAASVRRLAAEHHPLFLTGLGNAALLSRLGAERVRELDWWEAEEAIPGLRITALPAAHFSGRSPCDRNRALWAGFAIRGQAGAVLFAGDTGMGPQFAEFARRFGAPRLAIFPIGAYLPRWFMAPVHLSPEQTVELHGQLNAGTSLAVHYGVFRLGDDGQFDAVNELAEILGRRGIGLDRFWILPFGEGRDVPRR